MLLGIAVAALVIVSHGAEHVACAETLLVENFDDGDSAPAGWTMPLNVTATPTPMRAPAPALSPNILVVLAGILSALGVGRLAFKDVRRRATKRERRRPK